MEPTPPAGYRARPATMDDVEAATALFNAGEIAETGEPDYELDEVRDEWADYDLERQVVLVVAPDESLAGAMTVSDRGHVVITADGYVHPDHEGRGVGTFVVRWSEARAREQIPLAPPAARIVLRNIVNATNPAATSLLEREGYLSIRHFRRMQIDLDGPPSPAQFDGRFELRPFIEGRDERAIHDTVEEAFRDHWSMGPQAYDEWLEHNRSTGYDPGLWLQVYDGDQMAGALVGSRSGDEFGWIRYVAVRRPWRRQGLGLAMLQHCFAACHERGLTKVALGVDADNITGATRLYERAGMRQVRHHTFYEKVLRDGEPWEES